MGARHRVVNGEGPKGAKLFFVGEAPGAEEDATGRPFVGRAGKFLDSILSKHGIRRQEVFITNAVRCRPPNNRKPKEDEIRSCIPYLENELRSIKPEVVIALGSTAWFALSGSRDRMAKVVGKERKISFRGIPLTVVPNYHPSAAMRNRRMRARFDAAVSRAIDLTSV